MYVPSSSRNPLWSAFRFGAWKLGDAAALLLQKLQGFRLPDDRLQPFAQKLPMLIGLYESETQRLVKSLLRPGDIVIDGGAHAGFFTRIFSSAVGPKGRVLAFEIHPQTAAMLRSNVARNANVEVIEVALGREDGSAIIFEQPNGSAGHSITSTKPGLTATQAVPMRSLASILHERGLNRFDFMKLDIEGGEPDVLASLDQIPDLRGTRIIFEVKRYILEGAQLSPEKLLHDMAARGFSLEIVGNGPLPVEKIDTAGVLLDKANILAVMPG